MDPMVGLKGWIIHENKQTTRQNNIQVDRKMFQVTIGDSKIIGSFNVDDGTNVNSEYCSKTF